MTELLTRKEFYKTTRDRKKVSYFLAAANKLLKDDNLRFNVSSYGVLLSA